MVKISAHWGLITALSLGTWLRSEVEGEDTIRIFVKQLPEEVKAN